MFGQFDTESIPALSSFEQALARWEATKPWRGDSPHDPRPLGDRRHKNKTICLRGDRIECVLYRTPVVTYHQDGSIELHAYRTVTTQAFAWKLLLYTPLRPDLNAGIGSMVWANDRGYLFDRIRLMPDGTPHETTPPLPIREYRLDMPVVRAACRDLGYADFATWFRAAWATGSLKDVERLSYTYNGQQRWGYASTYTISGDIIEHLRRREYREIAALLGASPRLPDEVRQAIIMRTPGAVRVGELDCLTNMREVAAIRAGQRKYQWLV